MLFFYLSYFYKYNHTRYPNNTSRYYQCSKMQYCGCILNNLKMTEFGKFGKILVIYNWMIFKEIILNIFSNFGKAKY